MKKGIRQIFCVSVILIIMIIGGVLIYPLNQKNEYNSNLLSLDLTGGSRVVKFETNGGTPIADMTLCIGCASDPILPEPTKAGYNFVGWYKDRELTKSLDYINHWYNFETEATEVTVYAKWELIVQNRTITFHYNGADNVPTQVMSMTMQNMYFAPLDTPTRTGYTFVGWYYDENLKNPVVNYPESFPNDPVVHLYAKWEPISQNRTITFHYNGADNVPTQVMSTTMQNMYFAPLDTPTRTGYTFVGWYYDENLKNPVVNYPESFPTDPVVHLYAKWEPINICPPITSKNMTLTFYSNGGKSVDNQKYCMTCGITNIVLPTPERAGYKFIGWYYDVQLSSPVKIKNTSDNIPTAKQLKDSNGCETSEYTATLYAKWEQVFPTEGCTKPTSENVTITFDTDGGNSISQQKICTSCSKKDVVLPTPEKEGYVFIGWYYDKNLTISASITNNKVTIPTLKQQTDSKGCPTGESQVYLYAKWENKENTKDKILVKYNTNGGISIENSLMEAGEPLAVPHREGYNFLGWYTEESFENKIEQITEITEDNQELVVYAKWEKEASVEEEPQNEEKSKTGIYIILSGIIVVMIATISLVLFKMKK